MTELNREYRKAAERAVRDGDCRRAAYIYGKLLGDDRMAAQSLQARRTAPRRRDPLPEEAERPGRGRPGLRSGRRGRSRAIELYRELGNHAAAGDLLRRIGEEEAAVAEYIRAAEHAAAAVPPNHYHAGLFLRGKARRPDLAMAHFRAGWDRRPDGNATLCALELAIIHGERGEIGPIRALLDEADVFFQSVGTDRETHFFFNATASWPPRCRPSPRSPRNCATGHSWPWPRSSGMKSIAASRLAPAISTLFGATTLWTPSLVRDADFAAAAAQKTRSRSQRDGDPYVRGYARLARRRPRSRFALQEISMSVETQEVARPGHGRAEEVWMVDIVFEHADGREQRVRKVAPVQTNAAPRNTSGSFARRC